MLTREMMEDILGGSPRPDIITGFLDSLPVQHDLAGIRPPHRLAQYVAQLAHESARFRTTREYHDGSNYEGRRDLGNVNRDDGRRFRGRGLIQCTGRSNYTAFTEWASGHLMGSPDFVQEPEMLEEFPWAAYVGAWYWETRRLNKYADRGDTEMVTRRINGGLNGYHDRCKLVVRASLALLGYPMRGVRRFQMDVGLVADSIPGPLTRAKMHEALMTGRVAEAQPPAAEPFQA